MVLFIVVVVILFIIFSSGKSTGVSSPKRDSFYIGPPKMPPQDVNPYMRSRHNIPLPYTTDVADTDECTESTDTVPAVYPPVTTEPEIVYKNIAICTNPLQWWECNHPDLPAPSVAEQKIIDELDKYHIRWYREVSFAGLQVNKYSYPRYDIWIPSKMLIIEYDGKKAHSTAEQKAMDKLKNTFCKENGITIIRWNNTFYYNIPTHVERLMKNNNIKKRVLVN